MFLSGITSHLGLFLCANIVRNKVSCKFFWFIFSLNIYHYPRSNRYLHIHPTEEWSVQQNLVFPASTEQVQDKLHTNNPNIIKLLLAVGEKELSVKDCTSEHRIGVRVGLWYTSGFSDGSMLIVSALRREFLPRKKFPQHGDNSLK